MVKAVTFLQAAGSSAAFEQLQSFYSALGFAEGRGWKEDTGEGASFLAPLGNVEFFIGKRPSTADLLVEVTNLDATHQAVAVWLKQNTPAQQLDEIQETNWKSRIFTVEPVAGHKVSFWAWSDPERGRPLAIEGDLSAAGMRFGIVAARWNAVITERLLEGALDALLRSCAKRSDIEIVRVPGAWEIPMAARILAERKDRTKLDAIIPLGCLIRGETAHYEAIYTEVARGLGQAQQETGVPHSFGVLTCETLEQALNRAGIKAGNKGFEAAIAAIELVSVQRKLSTAQHNQEKGGTR
jgi:6,7-dimethyl-8-ribityllumazine synthase